MAACRRHRGEVLQTLEGTEMRPLLTRLLALFRRGQLDDEFSDEMSAHLEQSTADYVASGMSLENARLAARLRFGGTLQTAEAYRDRQGFPLLESIWQDISFAVRLLVKDRGFTLVATIALTLGNGVWKTRYGSDPSIVGRTIKVSEVPATVIGVMPEGFKFPINADAWEPLSMLPNIADVKRDVRYMQVFGRLAPGVTMAQAGAELDAIAANLAHDYPETNKNIRATIMGFNERYSGGATRLMLLALMGAVAFVLL